MASSKRRASNRKRLAGLRAALIEQRSKLLCQAPAALDAMYQGSGEPGDVADAAAISCTVEMAFRVAELRTNEIAEIEEALRRILDGSYGICQRCGEGISVARLLARPSASLCVDCQREVERLREDDALMDAWHRVPIGSSDEMPSFDLKHAPVGDEI